MIGVDIIDHSFSFGNSKHSLDQYKNKVLNKAEFAYCSSWNDLDLLWAIKESVYKNHFRRTGAYFLNPKRILISHINLTDGKFSAEIEDSIYTGSFENNNEYVYAICGDEGPIKLHLLRLNDIEPKTYPYLKDSVIQSHPSGFPEFIINGGSKYAYSRSHHGNYYISAMIPFLYN